MTRSVQLWVLIRSLFQSWRTLCVMGFLVAMSAAAQANLIQSQDWFEDATAQLTHEQVQAQIFSPYQGVLSRSYGEGAVWVRLRVQPSLNGDRMSLRISPPYLDSIEVFDPLTPDRVVHLGDRAVPLPGGLKSNSLGVDLPMGEAPRDIYLRLQSSSARLLSVKAFTTEQANEYDWKEAAVSFFYVALLSVFLFWVLVYWLLSPERMLGIFVVKQMLAVAYTFFTLGLGRVMLPAQMWPWQDALTSNVVVVLIAVAGYFDYSLLKEYRPPAWALRVQGLLALVVLCHLPLLWMGHTMWVLRNVNAVALAGIALDFLMITLAKPDKAAKAVVVPRWALMLIYGVVLLVTGRALLQIFGIEQAGDYLLYANSIHGVMTGVCMVIVLQVRALRLAQRQTQTQMALALAEDQAKQERLHREDREKLLAMLAHELKTPLSTVLMRVGPGTHNPDAIVVRALSEMNSVIETAVIAGQLEDGHLDLEFKPCNVNDILFSVTHSLEEVDRIDLMAHSMPLVSTYAAFLRIVLRNLLDNACKYSAAQSLIRVSVAQESRQGCSGVVFNVENTPGPAGAPDPQQVFSKYYRNPNARRHIGCGLGLYVSSALAHELHGQLAYRFEHARVCFSFWIPMRTEPVPTAQISPMHALANA